MPSTDRKTTKAAGRPINDRVRVVSNYARLLTSFALGLVLVRLLLRLGTDAYGLIIFLGAGTGIIGSLRETVAVSMVPELGAAYHDEAPERFQACYSTAFVLSLALALLALVIAAGIGVALPYCRIPPDMIGAARWFLVAKAVQAFLTVLFSPTSNMFLVTERMVSYNLWTIAEKVGDTIAAAVIVFGLGSRSAAELVVLYGWISAALSVAMILLSATQISFIDRRLVVRRGDISTTALRGLTRSFGWNSCVSLAINLYTRVTALVMNLTFGLLGNVVFGIAVQVSANVRQLSMGLVTGIDAVAARLNKQQGDQAIRDLSQFATRSQALVVLPGVAWLMVYVEPFVTVWVGPRLEDPAMMIPVISNIGRIMLLGYAIRSLSEGWMRILSGAGHAKKFAPIVFGCGLLNPLLALLMLSVTTGSLQFASPTIALASLMVLVHGVILPIVVARHLSQPLREIVGPLFCPMVAAAIAGVVAHTWLAVEPAQPLETLAQLARSSIVFGVSYVALAFAVATSSQERARFFAWLRGSELAEPAARVGRG